MLRDSTQTSLRYSSTLRSMDSLYQCQIDKFRIVACGAMWTLPTLQEIGVILCMYVICLKVGTSVQRSVVFSDMLTQLQALQNCFLSQFFEWVFSQPRGKIVGRHLPADFDAIVHYSTYSIIYINLVSYLNMNKSSQEIVKTNYQ